MTSKLKHNNPPINYKDAGVDVEAGYELVETIKPYVEKTIWPHLQQTCLVPLYPLTERKAETQTWDLGLLEQK